MKTCLTLLFCIWVAGCQSTANNDTLDGKKRFVIKARPDAIPSIPDVVIPEGQLPSLVEQPLPKRSDSTIKERIRARKQLQAKSKPKSFLPNELKFQQICRENVQVTYQLRTQLGALETFMADVQVQGTLLDISENFEKIKVSTTGWASLNANLRQWQPYLESPPLAESVSLIIGYTYWDDISNWHLCGIETA